ncbi:MAG: dihydropteroate synthase [Bacteroidales bacterium]|nr:dihydropteroate synthase [Bacteroidales bacterium]
MKRKVEIMGIVNLTEDSYFPESRCGSVGAVLERVSRMLDEGADIIDIGACSTRPGSLPVGEEEEWRRLSPVLPVLVAEFPSIRISIDTYWSSVVRRTYDLTGDFIVNDISAGEDDPMMLTTVGELGLQYVAMHKRGTPLDMQERCDYEDVVSDVAAYFESFAAKASDAGITDWILDPGFGFAKTLEQNYELLGGLGRLCRSYGGHTPRILVGVSRKSMIRNLLGISVEDSLPATQAVHMAALLNGADILRVHDVKEACQTVCLFNSMP